MSDNVWLTVALLIVTGMALVLVMYVIHLCRFTRRCFNLMSRNSFVTPCQLARLHQSHYGFFINWKSDV